MTEIINKAAFNRKEASQYLGVSENTFVKLLQSGRIRHVTIGKRVLVAKAELDRFLVGGLENE